ncbi:probable receptor-like protein kinase At5g59700 [Rutidosis leptorrhynchoides]|uniref:probable receptor-like protein kinase At5g59700 n=1 Tax=Rutidosis leptorrhynchoides TaxID=125765 RepID=UPI003A9A08EA
MESSITKFSHLQIPLENVLEATNNFDDKNVIGHGGLGKVYKGRILRSGKWVKIAARRLDNKHKQGIEFWTEISALHSLKHENIVSLIGFCDEKDEKVIINKHYTKGSLVMHLSNSNLTWIQRLRISVGVARALSYIHNEEGRNYCVIHRNISSSTILLDNKFQPKLSGFEYSINHSLSRMDDVLFSEAIGTKGYIDPQVLETGGVTHKSDIYSFGVVLWEIFSGKKALVLPSIYDRFLVSLAKFENDGEFDYKDIVLRSLYHQIDDKSGQTFTSAAILCIKDERVQRPDMKYLVQKLEKALELQLPYESLNLGRPSLEDLTSQHSHLKIRLHDITLATDKFSRPYRVKRDDLYDVYRAELDVWDKENFVYVEEKNKIERPKKCTIVLIKRLLHRKKKLGLEEFQREFEMLATCNHRNVVSLLGFCIDDTEKILITEYASNGSLARNLMTDEDKSILTWEKRLKICLDVAYGLKYLHHDMEDQKSVLHVLLSTLSIALDENFGAKIVDFEHSVFVSECDEGGSFTREFDVYRFGVVMFEILCGREVEAEMYTMKGKYGYVARQYFRNGTIMKMIDPVIKEERDYNSSIPTKGANKDSIDTFVKIAYKCLAESQDQRPTMKQVVKELEKALSFQVSCIYSFLLSIYYSIFNNTDSYYFSNVKFL